jgi:hypothetical protein
MEKKYSEGVWKPICKNTSYIMIKATKESSKKRTVAMVPLTTAKQQEEFGLSDIHDAHIISLCPEMVSVIDNCKTITDSNNLSNKEKVKLISDCTSEIIHKIETNNISI